MLFYLSSIFISISIPDVRYKSLFLRCGKTPEDMRKMLEQDQEQQNTDQDVRMAPAAASDLQN